MRARLRSPARALEAAPRRLLRAALAAAEEQDARLYLVGGAVRDLALDRPINDLDLALDGDVARFARICGAALREGVEVQMQHRSRFGTASVIAGGARLDVARLRTETYEYPGALPRVRATRSIERDLARRDFTVNAIALSLRGEQRGEIIDPYEGLADLASGTLRVLHPSSFRDDATRIWRGARTAAIAGLRPDPDTAALIEAGVRWLDTISGERLRSELVLTAKRGRAGRVLQSLDHWGALPAIHPALHLAESTARALRHRPRPLPSVRLVALLIAPLDDPRGVIERLSVDRDTRETVLDTRRLLTAGDDLDSLAALEGARAEARVAARWLAPQAQASLQASLRRWERTRSPLAATELVRLGVPQGPELGRALERLRRARFLGTLSTPAEARAAVHAARLNEGAEERP